MKNIIFALFLFGLGAPSTFAQTDDYGATQQTYCPSLSITIQRGARDIYTRNQVSELQKFLADYYDVDPSQLVTGYFGRITQSYVIRFQKEQRLPFSGIVGQLTRRAIARVCAEVPTVQNTISNSQMTATSSTAAIQSPIPIASVSTASTSVPVPPVVPPVVTVATTPQAPTVSTTSITSYERFINPCDAIVTGNQSVASTSISYPLWEHFGASCNATNRDHPILFSLTQEKSASHAGARNNIPNAVAYMGDYTYAQDFGRWLNYGFTNDPARDYLMGMSLDTVNYSSTNVTGWQLQEGNIFFGFNDMSIRPTSLDKDIIVEFDMRIRGNDVGSASYTGYSGHNIGISTILTWNETGRANKQHYFGVILDQTQGYINSLNFRDLPLCHDTTYDGCWYDPEGRYNEGRNIRYTTSVSPTFTLSPLDTWAHVRVPMSALAKRLGWVSPPTSWSDAKLEAMTFGLESNGATRYWVEMKNYRVYTQN
jgi:peptidoglycan hydrolase-like protein with peptidoglycan-binding domain